MLEVGIYRENNLIKKQTAHSPSLSIGRNTENDIVLEDRTVSRHHARFQFIEAQNYWEVENLSKKNPVRLNCSPIRHTKILFDGDKIGLGAYTLVVAIRPPADK